MIFRIRIPPERCTATFLLSTFIDEKVGTEYFGSIEDEEEVIRFRNKIKQEDPKNFDMMAVCVMAHGKEGFIAGKDFTQANPNLVDLREDVMQMFSNEKCNVLDKKPRLLFLSRHRALNWAQGGDFYEIVAKLIFFSPFLIQPPFSLSIFLLSLSLMLLFSPSPYFHFSSLFRSISLFF